MYITYCTTPEGALVTYTCTACTTEHAELLIVSVTSTTTTTNIKTTTTKIIIPQLIFITTNNNKPLQGKLYEKCYNKKTHKQKYIKKRQFFLHGRK